MGIQARLRESQRVAISTLAAQNNISRVHSLKDFPPDPNRFKRTQRVKVLFRMARILTIEEESLRIGLYRRVLETFGFGLIGALTIAFVKF